MMNPNKENIDRWLFDYSEGNLTPDQEDLLENFLVNNPEIESDLEAWQNAKIVSQPIVFQNKDKLKKRRKLAPFVLVCSIIISGTFGLLFLSNNSSDHREQTTLFKNNISEERTKIEKTKPSDKFINKNTSINNNQKENKNSTQSKDYTSLNKQFQTPTFVENGENIFYSKNISNKSFLALNNTNNSESNLNTLTNLFEQKVSQGDDIDEKTEENDFDSLETTSLSSLKLDKYLFSYDDIDDLSNDDIMLKKSGTLRIMKLINNVEQILEKDLGLSNIPDHTYALPEYSNIDALFSNIGSTSQVRFQSISSARWMENLEQRKFAQQISLDGYSRNAQSGFGLQVNYDYFANGSIQNWNTNLLFSPKIAISKSISFEPALRFKIGNKIISENRIQNHSLVAYESNEIQQFNFDSSIAIGNKLWYRDLDFGFTLNTPYFYIGGQIINVLRHQNNIYSNYVNQDMRVSNVYNAIIGTQYLSRNEKIQFSPYCFFESRNKHNRIFGGFSLKMNKIMIGGSYGTGKTTTGTIGLTTRNFSLLAQSSFGHTIAINTPSFIHQLTIRFNSTMNKKSRRYITF
jgi:hypothetical protein